MRCISCGSDGCHVRGVDEEDKWTRGCHVRGGDEEDKSGRIPKQRMLLRARALARVGGAQGGGGGGGECCGEEGRQWHMARF